MASDLKVILLAICLSCLAFAEHSNTLSPSEYTTSNRGEAPIKDKEAEKRKELLNSAADTDLNSKEGREALQSATDSVWSSLSEEQRSRLEKESITGETEALGALLNETGLVLSSPDKRADYLSAFQRQMTANSKRKTSTGLSELIATANQDAKGDPAKRQEQLAARAALQAEIRKNQSAVDYLTKHLKWTPEDAVRTVHTVEEQFKVLTTSSSSADQKKLADNYLKNVFGRLTSARGESDITAAAVISDFYTNKDLRGSEFGKVTDLFITAAKGFNTLSPQSPLGSCAGMFCIRSMTKEALVQHGEFKGEAADEYEALNNYQKTGTFPASINGKPTLSDGVLNRLSNALNPYEEQYIREGKSKLMPLIGTTNPLEVDRQLSERPIQDFSQIGKLKSGESLPVILKPDKTSQNGHLVDLRTFGGGDDRKVVIIDPNSTTPAFDVQQADDGTVTYTKHDGQVKTFQSAEYPVRLHPKYRE